ncbi:MAG: helix-turn-helix domain-containing protein [Elusimicrobia bacterium]|nr:helix-turn-helix domain-containing protein [Elusimicrobiota bacterium]MDE2314491.1 helix-turn-helix domain-containing protein [Elusimicrobiota bacterium]
MNEKYRHLGLEEREKIAVWRSRGMPLRDTAEKLGRSHSSLSRAPNPLLRPGVHLTSFRQTGHNKIGTAQKSRGKFRRRG